MMKQRFVALCCLAVCCIGLTAYAEETDQPNILIILADDLGWKDVGYHNGPIETPNIDRIAREGIELDRFYVQPSCSPTRAALMTGKIPMRLGIYRPLHKNSERSLPLDEKILPEYLAMLGYQPFMVGKWHLGHYTREMLPHERGFEHFYGSLTGGIGYWSKIHGGGYDWQRNGETIRDDGYATHLLVDEIRTLIETRDKTRPNFMYAAFQAPHLPNEAPEVTVAKYADRLADHPNPNRQRHAAMVDELDQAIGEVLAIYRDQNMLDNTIVLFMSDNGGLIPPGPVEEQNFVQKLGLMAGQWFGRPVPSFPFPGLEFLASNALDAGSDNTPLQGGKMLAAEGGVRVPAAIWWPGKLIASTHTQQMTITDVLPTLLDLAGASSSIPTGLDGYSQVGAMTGGSSQRADYAVSELTEGLAIYRWPWKMIGVDAPKLYNLVDDPLEQNDLSEANPELISALQARLDDWQFAEDPGIPFFNLLFDPDHFGGTEDREPWTELAH